MDVGCYKMSGTPLETNKEYRKIIGMLLYLSVNSRPDIAASVTILCRKVESPTDTDLNEAKRIVKYLKGTRNIKLKLGPSIRDSHEINAFSDSDWAEDRMDRKSTSGILCKLNGAAVLWKSKKQTIVAMSSAEAEFVALSETVKELVWIKRLCECFGVIQTNPIKVFTDSQSAMAMIVKQKFGNRTKHIDTKYHHVKDEVSNKTVELIYVPTDKNVADVLTKPLGKNKLKQFREMMGFTSDHEIEEECWSDD